VDGNGKLGAVAGRRHSGTELENNVERRAEQQRTIHHLQPFVFFGMTAVAGGGGGLL
jgi:hypothetical protein